MQTSYLLLYSIVYRVFSWFTNQVDLMKCLIGYEREIAKWPFVTFIKSSHKK